MLLVAYNIILFYRSNLDKNLHKCINIMTSLEFEYAISIEYELTYMMIYKEIKYEEIFVLKFASVDMILRFKGIEFQS